VLAGKISPRRTRTAVLPICGRNIDARTHECVVASQPEYLRRPVIAAAA
jgi:hypothetical protein